MKKDFNLIINNSYCNIEGNIPKDVESLIHKILTTHNDIEAEVASIFYRMNMLKRYGLRYKKGETKEENAKRVRQSLAINQNQLQKLKDSEYTYWYRDRKFPTGHLNIVRDLLNDLKANYSIIDKRVKSKPSVALKWKKKPFEPRYYQAEMIKLGLEAGRGVMEACVGSGKSLVIQYLIKELSLVSLIVVPSKGLKDQNFNGLEECFGNNFVQKLEASQIRKGIKLKPIRVVTIQTLAALQKSGDLELLLRDVEVLFCDEIHHAGSVSYTNLLPEIGNIFFRFGFTGTFLRNDSKSLDLWGFLSNVLYKYPATQAIKDGFLTPIEVRTYHLEGRRAAKYQKEYDLNYCGGRSILGCLLGIINGIEEDKQVLILVNRKDKSGKIIHEFLKKEGIENTFICGDDKAEEITQSIKDFNNKKIKILIGSSVIGEGIDIRSTDDLILAQGGKSEIVIVQAIGRLARLYPGKEIGTIHDLRFIGTKYLEKHCDIRKNIIERNFEPLKWEEL